VCIILVGLRSGDMTTPNEINERPVTLREHGGASVLVGNNIERIRQEYRYTLSQQRKPQRPPLWDGSTAGHCVTAIVEATHPPLNIR
jgi:hypothetical protein